MWFKKHNDSVDTDDLDAIDPVESLKAAAAAHKVDPSNLRIAFSLEEIGSGTRIDRNAVIASDGTSYLVWHVDSLRTLFRGDRRPPPDSEMAHYPVEYVHFFYGVERSVLLFASATREPTDDEFVAVYSLMRRRPDGRSVGPLHDIVWQAAALTLGLRPWSEDEYTAVFGQLARSARHFRMGPTSRNYMDYLKSSIGDGA